MAIGTATAIALGVSAAAQAYAAKKKANAAKSAANTQVAGAKEATEEQRKISDKALGIQDTLLYGPGGPGQGALGSRGIQGLYSPYIETAPASLNALHEFLDIPGAKDNHTVIPGGAYGPSNYGTKLAPGTPEGIGEYADQGQGLQSGFIPARQSGGFVGRGQPYLVGEAGPELFVPAQAGAIAPNQTLAGRAGGPIAEFGGPVATPSGGIASVPNREMLSGGPEAGPVLMDQRGEIRGPMGPGAASIGALPLGGSDQIGVPGRFNVPRVGMPPGAMGGGGQMFVDPAMAAQMARGTLGPGVPMTKPGGRRSLEELYRLFQAQRRG